MYILTSFCSLSVLFSAQADCMTVFLGDVRFHIAEVGDSGHLGCEICFTELVVFNLPLK